MSNSAGDGWQYWAWRPLISDGCCCWWWCASKRETFVGSFVADAEGVSRHDLKRFLVFFRKAKKRDEEEDRIDF